MTPLLCIAGNRVRRYVGGGASRLEVTTECEITSQAPSLPFQLEALRSRPQDSTIFYLDPDAA